MKNHFVSTLVVLIAISSVSNTAMACREGETKFVKDIQYTCICSTLSTGNKACS